MKNHTSFLVLAIVGVFALSACEGGNLPASQTSTTLTPTQDNQQGVASEVAIGSQPAQDPSVDTTQVLERQTEISESDAEALKYALQLSDITFCKKIDEQEQQEKCIRDVSDQLILNDAILKKDVTLCEKSSTAEKKEACQINLEGRMKSDELTAEPTAEQLAIYTKAVNENQQELCDTIDHKDVRESCVSYFINKTE